MESGINVGSNSTLTVNAATNAMLGDFNVIVIGVTTLPFVIIQSQTVKVSVVQTLRPPKLTPIADQMVKPGESATINVAVMDPTNQTGLTLSLGNAPGYVSLTDNGNGNGVIRIAPPMSAQSGIVVVRATNAGGLTDQIMFNVAVSGSLMITNASFTKPTLTILGLGFGTSGAIVRVNGLDVTNTISSQTDTKIDLKGSKKKFALKKGQNTVTVTVGSVTSNTATFNF